MLSQRNILLVLFLAALAALVLAACGGGDDNGGGSDEPLDKVTFMAGFKPQANLPFVGAYVAQSKGFFAEEGLEVDIQHVNTPGENLRFLVTGEVDFTTADAATVLERRAGDPPLPIVAVALIGQRGQQGFAVRADSGIETVQDWAGKTAGYKGSEPTADYLAILSAENVDRSSIEEVRVGFEPQVLTEGLVDIFPVFLSNEPDTLQRLGFETRVFEAADFGAPTLGLTYVTTEEFAADNPDVVRRFVRAVLRGIEYANDNRAEAVEIVMEFAPEEDPEHQLFMMETELAAAFVGEAEENGVGSQTEDQWAKLAKYLSQYGAIEPTLEDPAEAFTDEFLP